jgi:hypothetical protein
LRLRSQADPSVLLNGNLYDSGKTVNDREGPARHEDPALPFGERELELEKAACQSWGL